MTTHKDEYRWSQTIEAEKENVVVSVPACTSILESIEINGPGKHVALFVDFRIRHDSFYSKFVEDERDRLTLLEFSNRFRNLMLSERIFVREREMVSLYISNPTKEDIKLEVVWTYVRIRVAL